MADNEPKVPTYAVPQVNSQPQAVEQPINPTQKTQDLEPYSVKDQKDKK
jgi:hypothetical protein